MAHPLHFVSIEAIKEALQNNDPSLAVEKIKELLEREKNIPLNIGITGESGSGKSTFVNAFRGIDNMDEGAAPTDCDETTMEVTPYPHPNYPNVTLWDLPGIGTPDFPADKYLELVEFKRFDFFIIISDTRFRENDVKLAQEIQKLEKTFYFVRSKIDIDLQNQERSQREFNAERTLSNIRANCIQGLQKAGVVSPQVFLVASFDLQLYDFALLGEILERELPEHKKNALLLAMPNISLEVINKKKKSFHNNIKYWATASAAVGAVPVPGLSITVDVVMLVGVVTQYVLGFGLDSPSLKRLSNRTNVPYNDLIDIIISPLAATKITPDLLLKVIGQVAGSVALIAVEEGSRFIPILGIPLAMGLSFISTYNILKTILNMLAEDAQSVFKRALGLNTSV
ncbi:interferon-inducible GTPase 5-like [Sander lucioperca]|uniref:interferon-inducible GTPase 5-like n=1 Tax=Sander lucioperca TaxID=283035 RepID=UPI00125DC41A|nr:interferon-inducible GTPase 5-like [Sander lucioperca]